MPSHEDEDPTPEEFEDEFHEPEPPDEEPPMPDYVDPGQETVEGYLAYDPTVLRQAPAKKSALEDEDGKPLPEFDEAYRADFTGLAFVGALAKEFTWLGHQFVIKTLNVDELLACSRLTQKYDATVGQGLAYRTAIVALTVETVDGQKLPVPIGIDPDDFSWASKRFDYVKNNWFQFTIDAVYNEYLELEEKTHKVVTAMGKAFAPAGSTTG